MRRLSPVALFLLLSSSAAEKPAVLDELLLLPAPAPIYGINTPRQTEDASLPQPVTTHEAATQAQPVGVLAAAAAQAADDEEGGYVSKREELEALARVDWNRAEPTLRQLAGSPQPRTRALAQAMLYEHAPTESQRTAMQSIAADSAAPAYARGRAFEALARTEWEGRDEWLLGRMSDRSLLTLQDGFTVYAPYDQIVRADPGKWIPIMTGLLGHTEGAVRSIAANALGQFHLRDARIDAIRPLIPWISDPNWVENPSMTQLRVIQTVADLGLREAIPHLAHAVANDPDETNRAYAAEALAEFHDRSANDAMRAAVDVMESGHNREIVIGALIATGGLTAEELAAGTEAFLDFKGNRFELSYGRAPAATPLLVGVVVERTVRDRDDVAALLVARAAQLEAGQPELARKLIALVETWNIPTADALLVTRIEQQRADAQTITSALSKREALRTSSTEALRRLSAMKGMRAGIAAVLAGDAMQEQRILAGNDLEAQRAVLAAARLVREPLPIEAVAALFGRSTALDAAAEAWLIAEDSTTARAIVHKRHPGEILIFGSRLTWDPGHRSHGEFAKWEEDLLRRFRASNADECIALGSAGTWSPRTSVAEVRIREGKATLTFDSDKGPRTVPLSGESLGSLQLFLGNTRFDELGPLETGVFDGIQYEYVHLTRSSGRRVFMNNPGHEPDSPHAQLVELLTALAANAVR